MLVFFLSNSMIQIERFKNTSFVMLVLKNSYAGLNEAWANFYMLQKLLSNMTA